MSDTVKSWIEERRAIHAASGAGRWEKRLNGHDYEIWELGEFDDAPVSSFSADPDASAIVDAHNMFPRALNALQKVLELHGPVETGVSDQYWKEPDYCPTCSEYWPCETAQAIEGAINE